MSNMKQLFAKKFMEWLEEDIPYFDITTLAIPSECFYAEVIAKDYGIAVGFDLIRGVLEEFGLDVESAVSDGHEFRAGEVLLRIKGDVRTILMLERTLLNFLSRLCGIARTAREAMVIARKYNPNIRIAATRKTTPGLRLFEKYAVMVGGGDTHRFSLSDMIMIKDNHIRVFGGVKEAISAIKKVKSFAHKIEVEVTSLDEAVIAAKEGADIIMLDNMSPEEIERVIERLKELGLRDKVLLEASGGINLNNITSYAKTGVDIISMGSLTHSVKSCDISLEVRKKC